MESISANIAARLAAELIAELADGEAENHGNRFWMELARIINAHVPFPAVRGKTEKQIPMTDKEARLFGQHTLMPFGEFSGRKVDEVPINRLEWYAEQDFVDQLRRYLASDRIRSEE